MIKKTITFKNFDEEEVTKDFYFNINEAELMELELSLGQKGFVETVQEAIKAESMGVVLDAFKRLIQLSIGRREGDLFVKNDVVVNEFMQTNAYPALFMELVQNSAAGAAFVNGIMPKALAEAAANNKDQLVLDMQAKIDAMKVPETPAIEDVELPEPADEA